MENEYNRHKNYLTFLRNTFNVLPLSLKIITVLALFGLVSIPIIKFFSPKTSDALVTECLGVKVKDTCYGKLNEVIIVSGT